MRVLLSTQENKPGENPLSQVVDSSHHVILGKAEERELILGKHSFNITQGDKKSLEL